MIIPNTLKAILIVPVIAGLLGAVVPHTQGAIPAITNSSKIQTILLRTHQPTDDNPLGSIVHGLSRHCDGSDPAKLMNIS